MSIALPIYNQSLVRAREAVLRNDLFELRKLISQYTLDKQKAPQGLDDLVTAGYIKVVPKDPMTDEANWEVVQEDVLLAVDQQDPGISDVKSASNATGSDGYGIFHLVIRFANLFLLSFSVVPSASNFLYPVPTLNSSALNQ